MQQQRLTDYFPTPPTRDANATIYVFGCQILHYILSADGEVYGLLTDQDLHDAHYATRYALTAPGMLPLAVERITQVQCAITAVLDRRRAEQTAALEQLQAGSHLPPHDPRFDGKRPGTEPTSPVPTHPAPAGPGTPDALAEPWAELARTSRKAEVVF